MTNDQGAKDTGPGQEAWRGSGGDFFGVVRRVLACLRGFRERFWREKVTQSTARFTEFTEGCLMLFVVERCEVPAAVGMIKRGSGVVRRRSV